MRWWQRAGGLAASLGCQTQCGSQPPTKGARHRLECEAKASVQGSLRNNQGIVRVVGWLAAMLQHPTEHVKRQAMQMRSAQLPVGGNAPACLCHTPPRHLIMLNVLRGALPARNPPRAHLKAVFCGEGQPGKRAVGVLGARHRGAAISPARTRGLHPWIQGGVTPYKYSETGPGTAA